MGDSINIACLSGKRDAEFVALIVTQEVKRAVALDRLYRDWQVWADENPKRTTGFFGWLLVEAGNHGCDPESYVRKLASDLFFDEDGILQCNSKTQ